MLGSSAAPLADVASRFGGEQARALVLIAALLTTAATANAVLVVTSRIAFAMARDGLLPGTLGAVSARTGAPWASLLVNALLLGILATAGSAARANSVGGFLYVPHFLPPVLALVVLRRRQEAGPEFSTPRPQLVVPIALGASALLVVATGISGALGGVAWLAAGLVGHRLARLRP
jgi:basic amino acid/polyamine antiporter, APA family